MAKHERFGFASAGELLEKAAALGVDFALGDDLAPLAKPVRVGARIAPNSLAALPMEGCDCEPDGSPSELAERRYLRFAGGGAGLLWWEACAVVEEGRANPLQMMLTAGNAKSFEALLAKANRAAGDAMGGGHRPIHILQLTHSGRYSRPRGHRPMPVIPQHDPILDPLVGLGGGEPVVTDAYLDELPGRYAESARLARDAGFDGVDIKACHRYLVSELLASRVRDGRYGGNFENRTRLLAEAVKAVRQATGPDFVIACRFNIFDAHPYPYGFGEGRDDFMDFDADEPLRLVRLLRDAGVGLLSNTAGNPYYIYPQVTRPFDASSQGIPVPDEHPLESVARLFGFTRAVQRAAGGAPVVGNGYSWLRQFAPLAGAANLAAGDCGFVGFGRGSFAYPDAPRDILLSGGMDPKKCCVACSKCTQIMRDHGRTGCVVRDAGVYGPLFREARAEAAARAAQAV
ncbi:MAG: NADH:flavin oxidoreductase [Clostridiales bacterium]|jgi:2,4-dienoyl-CoA reductase-like NADH-dependent reductase (Old Yellow Enzyme family)|nr:NADH:flavin oxidoreductase [Clostridiales bacterium]